MDVSVNFASRRMARCLQTKFIHRVAPTSELGRTALVTDGFTLIYANLLKRAGLRYRHTKQMPKQVPRLPPPAPDIFK